ncbi:MAG: UDP-N-acetylmuramoyl-tripeptide--D-alanyl-D-alanine ligase [Bacilli bacterium]|nr:UDP-N-acetylmuramoyl-tripeptide--D-alanyl-D-alanine ligase [Bacilli bacterium]
MFWTFFFTTIPFLIVVLLKTKKALHMLQQNWYNDGNRYIDWIFKNSKKVFLGLDVCYILFFFGKMIDTEILLFLFASFSFMVVVTTYQRMRGEQTKKPLVVTKRVRRLIYTIFILYLIIYILIGVFFRRTNMYFYFGLLGILGYFEYFVVWLANIINKPIEKYVFYYYKRKAIVKLKSMSEMPVIGITGSYGKTSSKNILADILNVKYNAFPTPKNFNTTYGMINTINNYLDKFSDYFIAEMGAFKRGEIKEICDLVHPKYGILTKVGTAHLESFGSRENIQKGKFELIESLPSDGIGILNADDSYQKSYQLKNNCKIVWIGIEDESADFRAINIQLSYKGTSFDVILKGDKTKYHFETKLLGKANVYNILAGIALGKELGISMEQLFLGVKKVNAIEHRLELKKYGNINLIDDAYNSNPDGSKMAVEVLGMMPGKKIIVTPGMIELGPDEYHYNKTFGEQIAEVVDEVILIGEKQTKPIQDGLENKAFKKEHIHILNDVKLAFPLMQQLAGEETYVLLENDLPDIFNEK